MRGEKSNGMAAESQVDFHIISNGHANSAPQNTCVMCQQAMGAINLPENGLANNNQQQMRYTIEQSVSSMSLSSLSLSHSRTVQSSIPPCTT